MLKSVRQEIIATLDDVAEQIEQRGESPELEVIAASVVQAVQQAGRIRAFAAARHSKTAAHLHRLSHDFTVLADEHGSVAEAGGWDGKLEFPETIGKEIQEVMDNDPLAEEEDPAVEDAQDPTQPSKPDDSAAEPNSPEKPDDSNSSEKPNSSETINDGAKQTAVGAIVHESADCRFTYRLYRNRNALQLAWAALVGDDCPTCGSVQQYDADRDAYVCSECEDGTEASFDEPGGQSISPPQRPAALASVTARLGRQREREVGPQTKLRATGAAVQLVYRNRPVMTFRANGCAVDLGGYSTATARSRVESFLPAGWSCRSSGNGCLTFVRGKESIPYRPGIVLPY